MSIRVTGRTDETHAVVQQQPLTQSLYVPPYSQSRYGPADSFRASPNVHSQGIAREEPESRPATQVAQPEVSPAWTVRAPAENSTQPIAVSRSVAPGFYWTMGLGALLVLLLAMVLSYGPLLFDGELVGWLAPAQAGNAAVLTDTVQALVFPLDQDPSEEQDALAALRQEVASLKEMLHAQNTRPKWNWHAEPAMSDNPVLSITLEMRDVPVEPKHVLVRLSNLRTGQTLLVALAPADGFYRGSFKGFRDIMPVRSDMLSLQAGDPIYVEWLADYPVAPSLLTVDDAIIQPQAAPDIGLPAETDAGDEGDLDGGSDAEVAP